MGDSEEESRQMMGSLIKNNTNSKGENMMIANLDVLKKKGEMKQHIQEKCPAIKQSHLLRVHHQGNNIVSHL